MAEIKRITTEELAQIKERADKATAGPWKPRDGYAVESEHADTQYWGGTTNEVCSLNDGEYIENQNAEADAEFIANARQDVPALIAEVERLQKSREWYDGELYRCFNRSDSYFDEVQRLRAILEPLYVEGILSREEDEE